LAIPEALRTTAGKSDDLKDVRGRPPGFFNLTFRFFLYIKRQEAKEIIWGVEVLAQRRKRFRPDPKFSLSL